MKLLDYQLQSNVARLLARENITVIHANVPTACFDLKNRVMKLPLWKDFGKVVYDMLIAHEVGHAIFDDYPLIDQYFKENNIASVPDALNVIDDIRIERKVQDKYPGLPKIFRAAYKILFENDVFKVEGKDLSKLGFIDRLNLHAKLGTLLNVPMSDEELEFYNRCYAAKTTQDVIDLFEEIRDSDQSNSDQNSSQDSENEQSESDSGESGEQSESGDSGDSGEQSESGDSESASDEDDQAGDSGEQSESGESGDSESDEQGDASKGIDSSGDTETVGQTSEDDESSSGSGAGGPVSETQKEFEKNVSETYGCDASNDWKIREHIPTLFPRKSSVRKATNSYKKLIENRIQTTSWAHWRKLPDSQNRYLEYKKNVKKKIGVLIREFERRKAAFRYSRSSEARIGTIDVNNLHKYRYDDQIFNTVTRLADGKNHGMIFYIDYSYSMQNVLSGVIDQTLNLVYFCRKLSIPFEVYSYTSKGHLPQDKFSDEYEINLNDVVMNNIMSSSMSKGDFEIGFEQLFYQYDSLKNWCNYSYCLSQMESLGGTPLNAVIMSANHHCNDFQKKHRVDKLNVIILTDGDSQSARTWKQTSGVSIFEGNKVDLSQKKSGFCAGPYYVSRDTQQEKALKLLRKKANVIGMYLPYTKKETMKKIALAGEDSFEKLRKRYNKESFVSIPECGGYDALIILPKSVSIEEKKFEYSNGENLTEDRSAQTKLAREFARVNSGNKKSRVILTNFAELIA